MRKRPGQTIRRAKRDDIAVTEPSDPRNSSKVRKPATTRKPRKHARRPTDQGNSASSVGALLNFAENTSDQPLRFRIPETTMAAALEFRANRRTFWSHKLYRGPAGEPVEVHYCTTISSSEAVAQRMLSEKVLGFDMEWKPLYRPGATYRSFKEAASLIQLASETEVALFHIAMHHGTTAFEVIAPSLKEILESPRIIKTGVSILQSDGSRLKRYLGLEPQGLFELSQLHGIVKDYPSFPLTSTRGLVSLSKQVQTHLLLPLSKGKVRTSNWSRAVLDQQQIQYAASDAYAGYMLYRVMENKRRLLGPLPPIRSHIEQPISPVLEPSKSDDHVIIEAQISSHAHEIASPIDTQMSQELSDQEFVDLIECIEASIENNVVIPLRPSTEPQVDSVVVESTITFSELEERILHQLPTLDLNRANGTLQPPVKVHRTRPYEEQQNRNVSSTAQERLEQHPQHLPCTLESNKRIKGNSHANDLALQDGAWKCTEELDDDTEELLHELLSCRANLARTHDMPREAIISIDELVKIALYKPNSAKQVKTALGTKKWVAFPWKWVAVVEKYSKGKSGGVSVPPHLDRSNMEDGGVDTNPTGLVEKTRASPRSVRKTPASPARTPTESISNQPDFTPVIPLSNPHPASQTSSQQPRVTTAPAVAVTTATAAQSSRRLISALSSLRIRISQKLSLLKHEVAYDETLNEIMAKIPRSESQLRSIGGAVGFQEKAKECGVDLLGFVGKYGGVGEKGAGQGGGGGGGGGAEGDRVGVGVERRESAGVKLVLADGVTLRKRQRKDAATPRRDRAAPSLPLWDMGSGVEVVDLTGG